MARKRKRRQPGAKVARREKTEGIGIEAGPRIFAACAMALWDLSHKGTVSVVVAGSSMIRKGGRSGNIRTSRG
jgi:hypothetical protein